MEYFYGVLITLSAISGISLCHELGHLFFIKLLLTIPIKEFSLGIGSILYKKTNFSIRIMPFMSYVDFEFKDGTEKWRKVLVFMGGFFSNILLSCILFFVIRNVWLQTIDKILLLPTNFGIGPVSLLIFMKNLSGLGWESIILFFSLFSLFAGLINLLPLPALDGGWIVATIFGKEKEYEKLANKSIKILKHPILLIIWLLSDLILLKP